MAIKDFWLYQKRDVPSPWALYIVKEYDRKAGKEYDRKAGKRATVLDYTFYHENIPNATHSVSQIGLHHDSVSDYVNDILATVSEYTTIDNQDYEQVTREIANILLA
ncbi:MAG: hypothetical protein IK117_11100 [Bacteroidales bacterium]|nr:hypothetical protein [Bacteroidales bacterium]